MPRRILHEEGQGALDLEAASLPQQAEPAALSVSDAVTLASGAVSKWPQLTVTGEVSGFRGPNARSGHCYFEVKDDASAMSVIVWRGVASKMGFALRDGLQIQITGRFDIYKASGRLSFVASKVEAAGEGLLRQQVAELARKLEREGLMDPSRKRPIPAFCSRVCVVTSLSGSVIEDVKRTLARRNPLVEIQVVGCSVQGATAPATIVRALLVAESARPDAILLVRGGGSFEDLMCFNDEQVARTISSLSVPVVTGIGHEPDTSIADMVADRRASTPTAAAESVAPAIDEVERQFYQRQERLAFCMQSMLAAYESEVGGLEQRGNVAVSSLLRRTSEQIASFESRRCLQDPFSGLHAKEQELLLTEERLLGAMPRFVERQSKSVEQFSLRLGTASTQLLQRPTAQMGRLAASLDALSPLKVLGRGYSIVRGPQGGVAKSASELAVGESVHVLLGKGSFDARVTGIDS